MKNFILFPLALLLLIVAVALGCKKGQSATCASKAGGKGGNAMISLTAEHAGLLIDSCIFYIKYGTCDAPADGIYDDSAVGTKHSAGDTVPLLCVGYGLPPELKPAIFKRWHTLHAYQQ